jgi:hypothetical protein
MTQGANRPVAPSRGLMPTLSSALMTSSGEAVETEAAMVDARRTRRGRRCSRASTPR